jgi:hypothetical protein
MTSVLNLGKGVSPVRLDFKDHELTGGVRVIDYDQDGHYDIIATRALDWNMNTKNVDDIPGLRVYRSYRLGGRYSAYTSSASARIQSGSAYTISAGASIQSDSFCRFRTPGREDFEQIEIGDINGDGLQDVVTIQNGRFVIYLRNGNRPDLLVHVEDGVGAETGFLYAPLSNTKVYGRGNRFRPSYPQRAVSGGLLVVAKHEVSNGTGVGSSTTFYEHHYENAIEDISGRGFLGFSGSRNCRCCAWNNNAPRVRP